MTREELDAVRNHISNLPTVGAMYAPVLVEWVSVLLRQRDEVTAQRDNAVDTSKEGAWMARALDAERERDVAQAATVNAALIHADLVRERDEARHTLGRIAAVLFSSRAPLDDEELVEAMLMVIRERDEAQAELAFLRKEYGEAESSTLTRDALELKLQVMEQQRDEERKHHDALRAVWVAASDWLNHLAQNRVHYSDDGFGNLLDAVYAADARMTG